MICIRRIAITMMLVQHCVHSFHLRSIRPATTSSRILLERSYKAALWQLFSTASDGGEKKRVVFLGTPEVAATSLKKLYEVSQEDGSPFEIVSVVTQPPKRRRRKGKLEPSPVGKVAEELELDVISPEKAKDEDFLDRLENDIKPDLCITAAYGNFLPKRFLATPTYGTVNIHPSLLPRWRGASPVQRSLEAGDNPVGVTVLFTVSKMDAGPVISQKEETVNENETATTLLPHLFEIGTELLVEAMPDLLSGKITMDSATTQNEDAVVQAAMIDPLEAECKPWEESATTIHNKLRGFSMWPGAFVYLEVGEGMEAVKFKLLETKVLGETADPTDAVVAGPSKKDGLRLVCVDGSILEINRLQPATRKPMDALSFVNGLNGKTVRWVKTPSA